jgi:SAM-dependent methyltransferase
MGSYILAELIYPVKFLSLLQKLGRRFFLEGIYYYKLLEYILVASEAEGKNRNILDIGSGKSFLPLFYLNRGWETWILDSGDFYPDFDLFYLQIAKRKFAHIENRLRILKTDFLKADLPLDYFDFVTAISSLEHLRGVDDIIAVQKIPSLLKKGGRCIITLPFSQTGTKERILTREGFTFFQRDYELKCIFNRIVNPSQLYLHHFYVIGERNPRWGNKFFFNRPLNRFRNLWSLFPFLFWEVYYKGKSQHLPKFKYPGIIIIILEKK